MMVALSYYLDYSVSGKGWMTTVSVSVWHLLDRRGCLPGISGGKIPSTEGTQCYPQPLPTIFLLLIEAVARPW